MARVALRFAGLLLLAYGFLAAAQTAPTQTTRSLLVNVLDRNGNAVRNLTKDSFRVKLNGHAAALLDAHYNLAPRRIVVLLDMSGSMAGETEKNEKWRIAREAIEDFLTETPAEVQVALVTFSSKIHDILDFSQGRSSIIEWLKRGPSQRSDIKGTTPFFDAASAAAKLLEPALPGDSFTPLRMAATTAAASQRRLRSSDCCNRKFDSSYSYSPNRCPPKKSGQGRSQSWR